MCLNAWMDDRVCPGNATNRSPGVRHVCSSPDGHEGACRCLCGSTEKV